MDLALALLLLIGAVHYGVDRLPASTPTSKSQPRSVLRRPGHLKGIVSVCRDCVAPRPSRRITAIPAISLVSGGL